MYDRKFYTKGYSLGQMESTNLRYWCCILCLIVLLPYTEGAFRFTKELPNEIEVEAGRNATLQWVYSVDNRATELKSIVWGVTTASVTSPLIVENTAGVRTVNPNMPQAFKGRVYIEEPASLVIVNVSQQDNLSFTCDLRPIQGSGLLAVTSTAKLIINVAPVITVFSVAAHYTEGTSVSIDCTATGTPEPDVKWIRNEQVKSTGKNSAVLAFNKINRADDGQYTCQANNSVGSVNSPVSLLVYYKPEETKLTTSVRGNTAVQGETVTLTCNVMAANPAVSEYRFYLNNSNTALVKPTDGRYTINNVLRSQHFGKYKCVPHNDAGDGPDATVELNINVPPQIVVRPQDKTVNETNPVLLRCEASGYPAPAITWTKDGRQVNNVDIAQSSRNDTGRYVCKADNGVGQAITGEAYITVQYPAKVVSYSSCTAKSWIGRMVKLKCASDGVPTPTVTWYKPDGNVLGRSKATESTVDVAMTGGQDFGDYRCVAHNGINPADSVTVTVKQIKEPGSPSITTSDEDIQATSLTVRWTKPVDDGGSPITAYQVVLIKGGTQITNENVTDPSIRRLPLGGLEKDTEYVVKVYASNFLFEGRAGDKTLRTKLEGVPAAADLIDVPEVVKGDKVTLKWSEPTDNGAAITKYTVYKRTVREDGSTGDWTKVTDINDPSVTEYDVKLDECKEFDLVVTATNKFGEGFKEEEKIKRIKVLAGTSNSSENQTVGFRCEEEKTVLHAAYLTTIALLVLVIIVLLVILWRLRRRPESARSQRGKCSQCRSTIAMNPMAIEANIQPPTQGKSDNIAYEIPTTGDYMPLQPSTRSWEIDREKVNITKVIGKGAFSQVAKATVWNISGNQDDTTVAVKMLKADAPESDRKDLLSELELMKKLKPHPHVIKLMGCVTKSDPLLVLIEYVPYGDLLGYLRKSRGLNDTYFKDPDVKPKTSLTSEQLMKFAWQIADGMSYLSSRKIIHRDLAARNVLVGEGEKCKVTDFGMSRNVQQDDIYTRTSRGRLPVKWTAYEALLYGTYTTQSDVWSYGVVLYEILTIGGSPYPGINGRQIANKLQEGYRMPKPQHVDNKLYQVMLLCWQEDPANRPTFAKLKEKTKEMERNHRTYVNLKQYDNSMYANVGDLTAG